mgnify:CR=1 FL=1
MKQLEDNSKFSFPLSKKNFLLMAIAGVLIILGFILMTGDSSTTEAFNPDIFSTRRIVIGPTIAFIAMGVAIIYRPRKNKSDK